MINIPLEKLLFIDIETVGVQSDWESLKKSNLELSFVFENYIDWFQKRFPEDADKPVVRYYFSRGVCSINKYKVLLNFYSGILIINV